MGLDFKTITVNLQKNFFDLNKLIKIEYLSFTQNLSINKKEFWSKQSEKWMFFSILQTDFVWLLLRLR